MGKVRTLSLYLYDRVGGPRLRSASSRSPHSRITAVNYLVTIDYNFKIVLAGDPRAACRVR